MHLPFCDYHLLQFLNQWSLQAPELLPLDRALYTYFRTHKALGRRDRAAISQDIYMLVRWRYCLDALAHALPSSWAKRLSQLRRGSLDARASLSLPARIGWPPALYEMMYESLGELTESVAEVLQEPAPLFLRANAIKLSRDELLNQLPPSWNAIAGSIENSILIRGRPAIFQSSFFEEGYFEVQDEGSQYLAGLVQAHPGEIVIDYCAGAGGKSLAIAPRLQGKGQIFLHDIRPKALAEAKKRLRRAGIQNAQVLLAGHPQLARLKKRGSWVLVDAPCSGTGTLRRNPEIKERVTFGFVQELQNIQRHIFAQALSYLAASGTIIYATCSLLRRENEDQVDFFLKNYPLQLVSSHCLLPKRNAHDGFFAAVMKYR